MSFEITQGAVFYIVIMVIVIVLGVAIVVKGNPLTVMKKQQFSQMFEPGRLYMNDEAMKDLGKYVKVDCSGTYYTLTLNAVSFMYNEQPSDKTDTKKFFLLMEFRNMLFTGTIPGTGQDAESAPEITCTASESGEYFDCSSEVTMKFDLQGTGAIAGSQVFHFTAWKSNPGLIAAASSRENTLDKLLDTYPEFYVSSFDAVANVDRKCAEMVCDKIESRGECIQIRGGVMSTQVISDFGCYWDGNILWGDCKICPGYTDCRQYNGDACVTCDYPHLHCKADLFSGCIPVDAY